MELTNLSSLEKEWINRAKELNKCIVLPEAEKDDRVLNAGLYVAENDIANVVFLVKTDKLDCYKNSKNIKVINYIEDELKPVLASALYVKRKDKGLTEEDANKLIENPNYFAIMMLELGLVDGYVCGAITSTKDSLKPALQIIKGKGKDSLISSFFVMINTDKPFGYNGALVLADCGLNENPDVNALAKIAIDSAYTAENLCMFDKAKVAMVSYSTFGSASSEMIDKVVNAVKIAKVRKMSVIGLSGASGGGLKKLSDVCICAPETETFKIQELHLPIYHCLCLMLENHFFNNAE